MTLHLSLSLLRLTDSSASKPLAVAQASKSGTFVNCCILFCIMESLVACESMIKLSVNSCII